MPSYKCATHGRLALPNPPRDRACGPCHEAFGRWCADRLRAAAKADAPRGTARGGGQSSKAKGRVAVQQVAAALRDALSCSEEDVFVKAGAQGGCDVHLAGKAFRAFRFSIEVKNVESLNIWAALRQAGENAEVDRPPVVFFKRAQTNLFVALHAGDFLSMVKRLADQ